MQNRTFAVIALVCALTSCARMEPADEGVTATTAALTPTDSSDPLADVGNDRYIVAFKNLAQGERQLEKAGARMALRLPSVAAAAAYVPAAALAGLQKNPNVLYVEPDVKRYPSGQVTPYGISMVQADQVTDGDPSDVTVCIIDSGLNGGHEDLQSSNVSTSSDSGTGNPLVDLCGHGTHVAGTIAALNNDKGVVGILPSGALNLRIVKVFGDDCGWAYSSGLVAALAACQQNSPTPHIVVNMSLGGGSRSRTEDRAFGDAYKTGNVIPVAAAGNDGSNRKSYPASYDSVISVAAIDSLQQVASFSQHNSAVELAAPGVLVRSTMATNASIYSADATLTVGGTGYEALAMTGSNVGTASGQLVDCGLGTSTCAGASGAVCLIGRGTNSFAEKVQGCEAGGGAAAVIYNNEPGGLSGTLGDYASSIPAVGVSDTDGLSLLASLGSATSVVVDDSQPYATISGTSMATPHVTGAAALLWSHVPGLSNQEVRDTLIATALDLGTAGRDDYYGNGLVQVADAVAMYATSCATDADCDDADVCNGLELCDAGVCRAGVTLACDDGNVCTTDSCDAVLGCANNNLTDGTSCSNGDACDGAETCQAGVCEAGAALSCGADQTCDPASGCVTPPPTSCLDNGQKCKDSSACCSGKCYVGGGPPRCGA